MATYYISPTGDDSTGDGSYGNPWETMKHAYDNSSTDDTIQFMNGTHDIGGANADDTFYEDRTFEGESRDGAILTDTTTPDDAADTFTFVDCTVQDLTFQDLSQPFGGDSARIHTKAATVIQRCVFEEFGSTSGKGALIMSGIKSSAGPADLTVQSCVFKNVKGESGYNQKFRSYHDSCNFSFYNCVIGTEGGGYLYREFVSDVTFTLKNCILIQIGSSAFGGFSATTSDNDYNCLWDKDGQGFSADYDGANTITADPLFVDYDNGDYRLRQDSPCKDAGTVL